MRIYIDREHKRARRYIMKMAVVCAMVLLLRGSSVDTSDRWLVDSDYKKQSAACNWDICRDAFLISPIDLERIDLSKYKDNPNSLRAIINLSPNRSVSKGCMVLEESKHWNLYRSEPVLTYLYKEIERNGVIVRELILPHMEKQKSAKMIVIPLVTEETKEIYERRMQEAEKIKEDSSRRDNIEKALEFLVRFMNIRVCRHYSSNIKQCNSFLDKILDENYTVYDVYIKDILFYDLKDLLPNSNVFDNSFIYCVFLLWRKESINNLLEKNIRILEEMKRKYPMYKIDDSRLKEILEENPENENRILLSHIKGFERECEGLNTYTGSKEELPEYAMNLIADAKDLTVMYINILTGEGIPLSEKENKVLRKYISESSKEIEYRAAPWNRNLVKLLIKSWIRYDKIEQKQKREIDEIVAAFKEENKKIKQELEMQDDILPESIYIPEIVDAVRDIVEVLKTVLKEVLMFDDFGDKYKPRTEIDKQKLDCHNIELSNKVIFQLLRISKVGKDPKITQGMFNSIKEKIDPLIKEISKCHINFISIKELIMSVARNKREVVNLFYSILFDNQVLTESKCERVIFLKEMTRETLNSFADLIHYRFARKIDYNKFGQIEKLMEEETACLKNCNVKEAMQCLYEYANKFWYVPRYCFWLIECIEKSIAQENTLEYITNQWFPYNIKQILMCTYQAYKSINDIVMCDEIWKDPAALYIGKYYPSEERKSYFIYKENDTTYIEETDFNNSDLEVIINAKTHSDIAKAIRNKRKSVEEVGEALLEPSERQYLSKDKENRRRNSSLSSESE